MNRQLKLKHPHSAEQCEHSFKFVHIPVMLLRKKMFEHLAFPCFSNFMFFEKYKNFQGHPNDIIAIHCTHGFNRTGFLIAAYLAKEMDWAVDAAIRAFAKGRPDGIYKQLYLDDLVRRYGDEEDHVQVGFIIVGILFMLVITVGLGLDEKCSNN